MRIGRGWVEDNNKNIKHKIIFNLYNIITYIYTYLYNINIIKSFIDNTLYWCYYYFNSTVIIIIVTIIIVVVIVIITN